MDVKNFKLGALNATDLAVAAAGAGLNFVGFDMISYLALAAYFAFWPRS